MAVLSVTPLHNDQTGTWGRDRTREYASAYHVLTDDVADGPQVVIDSLGISINTKYAIGNDNDDRAYLQSLTPTRTSGNRLLWLVSAKWGTANTSSGGQNSGGEPTDDPTEWRDQWDISPVFVSRPVEKATLWTALAKIEREAGSEGPVVNSAGTIYDPALEAEYVQTLVRITKFFGPFPNGFWAYQNSINADEFTLSHRGFVKPVLDYQARMHVAASLQFQDELAYWKLDISILIDEEVGWRFLLLDRGYARLISPNAPDGRGGTFSNADMPAAGEPTTLEITDLEGNTLSAPVRFDGEGKPAAVDADPFYIQYGFYKELNFAPLPL